MSPQTRGHVPDRRCAGKIECLKTLPDASVPPSPPPLFPGHQQHLQRSAFGAGFLIHFGHVRQILDDTVKNADAAILVNDLAPAEKDGYLAAVAVLKKTADMAHLGFVIVVVGLGTLISLICTTLWRFLASCFFFCCSYLNLP